MSEGGLVRRLMTQRLGAAPETALVAEAPAVQGETAVAEERPTAHGTVRGSVGVLASLAPIIRAALVYPGISAPAGVWAAAVRRMSEASTQLTDQLAQLHRDEIDIGWARRELHVSVVKIVAEFWVAGVVQKGGACAVDEVPLNTDEMLGGLVAAERAVHAYASVREPVPFSVEAELLQSLALITVHAQAYANLMRAKASVELSLDAYVMGVADAILASVARGVERAGAVPGLDRQEFTRALLNASAGIVVTSCETAINDALQQLGDTLSSGAPAPPAADIAFPLEQSVQLIDAGIGRLAGTYAYIAGQAGTIHG